MPSNSNGKMPSGTTPHAPPETSVPARPPLDRETIATHTVSYFRKDLRTSPDIRLVQVGEARCVVKDWSSRSPMRRLLLGRFLLRREHRFLQQLRGLVGVPRSFGFPDADSLAIEYLQGQTVSEVNPHFLPDYFDRLESLVRQIHARGIVHGDLDQENNILVLEDGNPAIIDFGGSLRRSILPVRRLYFDLLRRHDLWCIERLRRRFAIAPTSPHPVPPPSLTPWQKKFLILFNKMETEPRAVSSERGPEAAREP